MSDAKPESGSVIDLGGAALAQDVPFGPVPFDFPFPAELDAFFGNVLDGIVNTGGMPRMLFVARSGDRNRAGLAALGLAKAASDRRVEALLVDASFVEPQYIAALGAHI